MKLIHILILVVISILLGGCEKTGDEFIPETA